jgi:hypothetical protein
MGLGDVSKLCKNVGLVFTLLAGDKFEQKLAELFNLVQRRTKLDSDGNRLGQCT